MTCLRAFDIKFFDHVSSRPIGSGDKLQRDAEESVQLRTCERVVRVSPAGHTGGYGCSCLDGGVAGCHRKHQGPSLFRTLSVWGGPNNCDGMESEGRCTRGTVKQQTEWNGTE